MAKIFDLFQGINRGLGPFYSSLLERAIKKISEMAREFPGKVVIINDHLGHKLISVVSPDGKRVYYGKDSEPIESLRDTYAPDLERLIKELEKINFFNDIKKTG